VRSPRLAFAIALATVLLTPTASRANCGAEGCPFVRRGLGTDVGRFGFDLRYQDVTQDKLWSGSNETSLDDIIAGTAQHGEVELFTHTRSWVAEASAALGDRLRLVATLPYINREHRHWLRHAPTFNPLFVNVWKYQGLGDATVLGQFTALRRANGSNVSLEAGVKLPTGRQHVPNETVNNFGFESALEPSARPGTGSTDGLVGALASLAMPWRRVVPVTISVLARFNGKGTDDYQVGDEVQVGLASGWSPIERVTLIAQANFSAHGSDVSAEPGVEAAHTGMRSLFLTPGVSVRVLQGLAVYGLYQSRVSGRSDEATVVARDHFLVGTSYSLGH
jgi:hypothetical protein